METGIVIVTTTYPSKESALDAAREIIRGKLAACAHIYPVTSVYHWEGKLEESGEFALAAKTTIESASRLMERLRANHPYALPELLITPAGGDARYIEWVKSAV